MAFPATTKEAALVCFDLILSNEEWKGQELFDYITERFKTNKIEISSFTALISVKNLNKHRSLFNNTTYRAKIKLARSRYREKTDYAAGKTLFDICYPVIEQSPAVQPTSAQKKDKRKIDSLQKKLRRWKVKFDLLQRKHVTMNKDMMKASKKALTDQKNKAKS